MIVTLTACPICNANTFVPYLKCEDRTVSHETFQIVKCENCGLLFTNPRPDENSLGKYYLSENYISHKKGIGSLIDIIYKVTRVYTLQHKLGIVKQYAQTQRGSMLVDYGCGTGDFLKTCERSGLTPIGVEPSEKARQIAIEASNCEVHPSLENVNKTATAITLWHVLEHVPDPNSVLKSLYRRLDKNGTMFIAVPNHESYDAQKYKSHWAAYDVPRHLWHFSKKNMLALLNNNDFKVIKILPMKLDAYYVSILSEKYKAQSSGIISFVKGLYVGLRSNLNAQKDNHSSLIYIIRKK